MHLLAIVLLVAIDEFSAYSLRLFPYSLLLAVAACAAAELLLSRYYLKHSSLRVPFPAIITGLVIGSVAPISGGFLAVIIASVVAVLSKAFLKIRGANLFNPAAFGMFVGLGVFAVGDVWWASSSLNIGSVVLPVAALLVIATYEARRLTAAFSFIVTFILLDLLLYGSFTLAGLEVAVLGTNFFFALLMLPDPKTSPHKAAAQGAYGIGIAIVYLLLASHRIPHSYFIALLIGNLGFGFYRARGRRLF